MAGTPKRLSGLSGPRPAKTYGRVGLIVALLGAVLVVATATSYTSTHLLSGDQSAWLRKGTTIAQINGPSGRYEAVASDKPAVSPSIMDPLQVVQGANGQVYTADPKTGKTYQINLNTMTPQAGPDGDAVLASGSHTFVVNSANQSLTPFDPSTLTSGKPIRLPDPVSSQVIGGDGTVYVGGTGGTVTTVTAKNGGGYQQKTVHLPGPASPVQVAIVGTRPVAIDAGVLYQLGSTNPSGVSLPGPSGGTIELAPNQPAGWLWLVRGSILVGVDPATGQTASTQLPSHDTFGPPVTNGGRVYVPDDTAGSVLVFSATQDLTPSASIAVPGGAQGATDIEVLVKDGNVWIDNPTSKDGKMVTPNGTVTTIDKGTGDGVVDPTAPVTQPTPPKPTPTTTPPPDTNPTPASTPSVPGPAATVQPVTTAPITVPTATAPTVTVPATTTTTATTAPPVTPPPATTATTEAQPKIPDDLQGKTETEATAELQAAGFTVGSPTSEATASPSGQPDIVASSNPTGGTSEPKGTSVSLAIYEVAVPAPSSGESPDAYCQAADALGFTCSKSDQGAGSPQNQVTGVNPAAGTLEPAGTALSATYFSSAVTYAIPDCGGKTTAQCQALLPANSGFTVNTDSSKSTDTTTACNVSFGQSPAAGTQEPASTAMTIQVDPNCDAPLYELQRTSTAASEKLPKGDTTDELIHYLTFNPSETPAGSDSADWKRPTTAGAYAYAPPTSGTTCAKAGTVPLYRFEYPTSSANSDGQVHWYFLTNANFADKGWDTSSRTAIACVFPTQVTGTEAIYGTFLNSPVVPGDYSYSPSQGAANSSLFWYQPTS